MGGRSLGLCLYRDQGIIWGEEEGEGRIIWVEEGEGRIIWVEEEEEEEGTIVYSGIHSTLYIWFILIHMKSNYKLAHKTIYFLSLFFISLKKKYTMYQDKKRTFFRME